MRVLIKQKEERNASDNLQKIWRSLDKQLGCIIKKKKMTGCRTVASGKNLLLSVRRHEVIVSFLNF